jgi:hypothetical protein
MLTACADRNRGLQNTGRISTYFRPEGAQKSTSVVPVVTITSRRSRIHFRFVQPGTVWSLRAFCLTMLEGSGFTSLRQKARFAQIVCVVGILLGEMVVAGAEIPLPRPRPAEISADQAPTSNPQPSLCQQELGGFADFKALPAITGPGECLASDVVALGSVSTRQTSHCAVTAGHLALHNGGNDRALAAR